MSRALFPTLAAAAAAAAAAALVFSALFFGGGAGDRSMPFVGGAAALLACALLASVRPRLAPLCVTAAALFIALVAWIGISIAWSAEGDRSWAYLNRGLVYLAFGAVGLALGSLAARRVVAEGLAGALGLVAVWALAGKAIPALGPDARIARLRAPVGIWNELALLGDVALPLGLWLATSRGRRERIAGTLLIYAWTVALALTLSRGGVLVAVAVVLGWLALAGPKLESLVALVVAGAPAGVVAAIAFALPGVTSDAQPHSSRVTDGALLGLALLAGAVVVAGLTLLAGRLEVAPERRRALRRATAVVGAVALLAVGAVGAAHASSWWNEFRNPASAELSNQPGRLASASSNNRWRWWAEAWRGFRDEPLAGNGAGTFELVHLRYRDNDQAVTEPHNLPLQFLAETGIVGLLLFVGAFGTGVVASFGRERATVALWLGLPAYLLHGLLEIDWDFLAVSVPFFVVLGVLLARPAAEAPRLRPLTGLAAAAGALAVLASLASPWLADRALDRSYAAGSPATAAREAKRAHALDPLSIEPLLAWAAADLERGDPVGAYRRYLDAVALQPENPDTWLALGSFEYEVAKAPYRALPRLEKFTELDPQSDTGGDLYREVLARVNAGG